MHRCLIDRILRTSKLTFSYQTSDVQNNILDLDSIIFSLKKCVIFNNIGVEDFSSKHKSLDKMSASGKLQPFGTGNT